MNSPHDNGAALAVRHRADALAAHEMGFDQLAAALVKSGWFADVRDVSQAIVKMQAGREVGLPPVASLMGIYVVKGRVTYSYQTIGALIQRSGRFGYRAIEATDQRCEIEFADGGKPIGTATYTIQEATRAGLAGNDTYRKFPDTMLFARCMSKGARRFCPAVFGGPVYVPEDFAGTIGPEGEPLEPAAPAAPRPARRRMADAIAPPVEEPDPEGGLGSGDEPSEPPDAAYPETPTVKACPAGFGDAGDWRSAMLAEMRARGWADDASAGKFLDRALAGKGITSHLASTPEQREAAWSALASGKWDSLRR